MNEEESYVYNEDLVIYDDDNGYSWRQCGFISSKNQLLPERVQYKGSFYCEPESKFDLAWYVREDLKDADRALTLQALAVVLLNNGLVVGWIENIYDNQFSILVINLPQGQVAYKIPMSLKVVELPEFKGEFSLIYSAVNSYESRDRLQDFIKSFRESTQSRAATITVPVKEPKNTDAVLGSMHSGDIKNLEPFWAVRRQKKDEVPHIFASEIEANEAIGKWNAELDEQLNRFLAGDRQVFLGLIILKSDFVFTATTEMLQKPVYEINPYFRPSGCKKYLSFQCLASDWQNSPGFEKICWGRGNES